MKTITKKELQIVLADHELWIKDRVNGKKADLRNTDLSHLDLYGVDLRNACLCGASLKFASLVKADLSGADLRGADLSYADLFGANIISTNLSQVNLSYANLTTTNFENANLENANVEHAYLDRTTFNNAEKQPSLPMACPETGSFIGYKKCRGYIVVLEIPADAKRLSATTNKCRCDKAKVLRIEYLSGMLASDIKKIPSGYDRHFVYHTGETVFVKNFDEDRWHECSTGIHFFMNRNDAVSYF